MTSCSTRRFQRVSDSFSVSSSSSSSSASSFGLRTPDFDGADPHLANLDFGHLSLDAISLDDKKNTYESHPPSFELPAPPPLTLPRAFLHPRPAPPPPHSAHTFIASGSSTPKELNSTTPRPYTPLDFLDSTPTLSSPIAEADAPLPPQSQSKPQRRRRGRSVTLHILWRSTLSDEARMVLKEFYEWKTGYAWPDLNGEGMELWSAKVEAAGL